MTTERIVAAGGQPHLFAVFIAFMTYMYNDTLFWYMYSVSKPVVYIYIHTLSVCL